MKRTLTQTAAIAALCLAGLGGAYAADSERNDALGIAEAKISLTQAIGAAEGHVGGKASSAEYEHENGRWVFAVEVVKGREVMDVEIDPSSGQVLSATLDKADSNDDEDREGGSETHG